MIQNPSFSFKASYFAFSFQRAPFHLSISQDLLCIFAWCEKMTRQLAFQSAIKEIGGIAVLFYSLSNNEDKFNMLHSLLCGFLLPPPRRLQGEENICPDLFGRETCWWNRTLVSFPGLQSTRTGHALYVLWSVDQTDSTMLLGRLRGMCCYLQHQSWTCRFSHYFSYTKV